MEIVACKIPAGISRAFLVCVRDHTTARYAITAVSIELTSSGLSAIVRPRSLTDTPHTLEVRKS